MRQLSFLLRPVALLLVGLFVAAPASAQYFGRNKVQYDNFDFKRFETEHFEFYFYPEEERAVKDAARMAERWYRRHSRTFLREFGERKPIIFYANDADFQQTNVIRGQVGQGTGGVTESLKERVVMPLTGMYGETDHVLGHELVHSFQYDIALRGDVQGFSLRRLPLWLVEGMAEYLSVGREDPHTAMWLRDAALRDDLPTVNQLTRDMSYFPYRYGQAYMAYIGGKYGDPAVANLYKLSGRVGVDSAFVYALGITADSLSSEWQQSVRDTYLPEVEGRTAADSIGRAVIGTPGADDQLNISPSVSPDGRYVAFISRRDVFTVNLFVADAETGEIIQELQSTTSNPHFDALRFINSAGAWSPDGQQFAFVTFAQGDNEINILDVASGKIQKRTSVQDIGAITNLAWSPDGNRLAFTGLDGGISDLYVLNLETRGVRQLTNDRYADIQPTWSPDGTTIAFTTDRGPGGTDLETLRYGEMRIGLIDVESRRIETFRPFLQGQQHNPQFSPDGRSLYFISDHDGFKDVYRYVPDTGQTYRVTNLQTGVSGITALSPAMSVASRSGRMMFSVYANSGYSIVGLEQEATQGQLISPVGLSTGERMSVASLLPPPQPSTEGLVGGYLNDPLTGLPLESDFDVSNYSGRLHLDYVAPPSVGTSVGGPFGTQVAGGVGFFFSDMLGNKNLTVVTQANGTFKDIGGQVSYLDLGDRLNYGASVSHIPYLRGFVRQGFDNTGSPVIQQFIERIYQSQVSVLGAYPLTQTRRFELTGGVIRYGFDLEVREFTPYGVREESLDEFEPDPIYLALTGLAYVGDFANFGFTSPLQGGRYRFEVMPLIGSEDFTTIRADYRRYFFREPWTLAFRALHIGNYGASLQSDNTQQGFALGQEYLGDPYRQGFIRGYSFNSIFDEECSLSGTSEDCRILDRLYGTRIGLMSAELRFPLFGTEQFGLINFPYLPTELALFTDAAIAWTNEDLRSLTFTSQPNPDTAPLRSRPLVSAGIAARFNLLGAFVFELFYVHPFQRPDVNWDLGLVIRPGW